MHKGGNILTEAKPCKIRTAMSHAEPPNLAATGHKIEHSAEPATARKITIFPPNFSAAIPPGSTVAMKP